MFTELGLPRCRPAKNAVVRKGLKPRKCIRSEKQERQGTIRSGGRISPPSTKCNRVFVASGAKPTQIHDRISRTRCVVRCDGSRQSWHLVKTLNPGTTMLTPFYKLHLQLKPRYKDDIPCTAYMKYRIKSYTWYGCREAHMGFYGHNGYELYRHHFRSHTPSHGP